MHGMSRRIISAVGRSILAFFLGTFVSGVAFTFMVRNDPDGQAGMGAAIGGLYLGCIIALVTFIVSIRRSGRPHRK